MEEEVKKMADILHRKEHLKMYIKGYNFESRTKKTLPKKFMIGHDSHQYYQFSFLIRKKFFFFVVLNNIYRLMATSRRGCAHGGSSLVFKEGSLVKW